LIANRETSTFMMAFAIEPMRSHPELL